MEHRINIKSCNDRTNHNKLFTQLPDQFWMSGNGNGTGGGESITYLTGECHATAIASRRNDCPDGIGCYIHIHESGALSGSSAVVGPTVTTTYTVTGLNASGCSATKTVQVVVEPAADCYGIIHTEAVFVRAIVQC